jgi:hypothetical protein
MEFDIIEKFCTKTGFSRKRLNRHKTFSSSNIAVHIFLGDLHSTIIGGSLLLPANIDKTKYNVVITWPGLEVFFDTDEVLTLSADLNFQKLYMGASDFSNEGSNFNLIVRSANEYFLHVNTASELFGTTRQSLMRIQNQKKLLVNYLTCLHDAKLYKTSGVSQKSVVFFPIKDYKTEFRDTTVPVVISDNIYKEIFKSLSAEGFQIICIQNDWTFDLQNQSMGNVIFVKEPNFEGILKCIRKYGCFFSVFSDLDLLGYMAQVPTFSICQRSYYLKHKRDLEAFIYDCVSHNKTIFSFFESMHDSNALNYSFLNSIIERFVDFYDDVVSAFIKPLVENKEINLDVYIEILNKYKKPKFISKFLFAKEREKNES